eukprot:scaffold18584_cov79-Cyclotella_meneghiniana.AAC.5
MAGLLESSRRQPTQVVRLAAMVLKTLGHGRFVQPVRRSRQSAHESPNQQPGITRGMKNSAKVVVGRWTHACNMKVMACVATSGGGNHTENVSRRRLAIHCSDHGWMR